MNKLIKNIIAVNQNFTNIDIKLVKHTCRLGGRQYPRYPVLTTVISVAAIIALAVMKITTVNYIFIYIKECYGLAQTP